MRMLPDRVPGDTPAAEITMFDIIRTAKGLDQGFCLHSLGIARHRRKDYAEGDLVYVGPEGVYCLEVKGGHVDRKGGTWTIGWPGGKTYESKEGPFVQSEGVRWALLDFLKTHIGPDVRNELLLGWGVAFPDIKFERTDPEWDQEVIFDLRDKEKPFSDYVTRLEEYFRRRLTETKKPQPPRLSFSKIKQIVDCLRGDFETAPSVRGLLSESKKEIVRLSRDQFTVLNYALNQSNPRIICDGAAGTGKTIIALEAARRLSASGKKTLLLCFNDNLGRFLAADASETEGKLQVSTLYKFFLENIRKAGLEAELLSAKNRVSQRLFYDKTYPEIFEKAAATLIEAGELPLFDSIVIDEAQDILSTEVMNSLDVVLDKGFKSGSWLVFIDSGVQSDVYERANLEVLNYLKNCASVVLKLDENFRNPRGIVAEMCALTKLPEPYCRRELQSKVEYVSYEGAIEQGRKLRALLVELMRQGVPPGEISVLSTRNKADACITKYPPEVGKQIQYLDADARTITDDAISASSIAGFKGLENEVVILTDLPSPKSLTSWERSMIYVGMTRPRSKLYALVDGAFLDARLS
jgi:hypothetical protein